MFTAPEDLDNATLQRQFKTAVKSKQVDMALSYAVEVIDRLDSKVAELDAKNKDLEDRLSKAEKPSSKQGGNAKSSQKKEESASENDNQ